jgi:hypothetical protein
MFALPTPYFFFGLAFFGALAFAAVFGRGAFGVFVGTLVTFLALDGDFFALAGAERFFSVDFTAVFLGALAFFTLAALCFFTLGADAARPRAGAAGTTAFSVLAAANFKDPDAPLPFV